MIKEGFALLRISDGEELAWWETLPPRIETPGGDVAFGADVGWAHGGFKLTNSAKEFPDPPPPPEPPVPNISDRQFFQQLAVDGFITTAEALAAVKTGTIPVAIQTIVDGIADPVAKFSAEMILSGATVFERSHPLTDAVGTAAGKSPAEIDDFFRAAATL